ncbi:unnamed protein product, partial [marine sediment metagenome]
MPAKLIPRSSEELINLYWVKRKNSRQIAKMFGVAKSTVLSWMKDYEIPVRPPYRERKKNFSKEDLGTLYWNQKLTQAQIAEKIGVSQSLIYQYMKKWNISARTLSEIASGEKNPFFGKKHTAETKQKIRSSKYHRNLSGRNNPFYGNLPVQYAESLLYTNSITPSAIADTPAPPSLRKNA